MTYLRLKLIKKEDGKIIKKLSSNVWHVLKPLLFHSLLDWLSWCRILKQGLLVFSKEFYWADLIQQSIRHKVLQSVCGVHTPGKRYKVLRSRKVPWKINQIETSFYRYVSDFVLDFLKVWSPRKIVNKNMWPQLTTYMNLYTQKEAMSGYRTEAVPVPYLSIIFECQQIRYLTWLAVPVHYMVPSTYCTILKRSMTYINA